MLRIVRYYRKNSNFVLSIFPIPLNFSFWVTLVKKMKHKLNHITHLKELFMKNIIGLVILLILTGCAKEEPKQSQQQPVVQPPKTGAMLVAEAKANLTEAKAKLATEGNYGCCIKEPCSMCAMEHGKCGCYEEVKRHEAVCNECYGGWMSGKGTDPKIKKEDVKAEFMESEEHHH